MSSSFKPFLFILRYCFMVCLLSEVARAIWVFLKILIRKEVETPLKAHQIS
jgi:hypothetical protein